MRNHVEKEKEEKEKRVERERREEGGEAVGANSGKFSPYYLFCLLAKEK